MELTFSNDNYFFLIDCPDLNSDDKTLGRMINQDIVNFSVTEELGKMTTGSLTLLDNGHIYSRFFRYGMQFNISWGYKKWNQGLINFSNNKSSFGINYRSGLKCIACNPHGSGDSKGNILYNIDFYSMELKQQKKYRVFETGNLHDVVVELFKDCDVLNPLIRINEKDTKFNLDTANSIRQFGTSFAMLRELAEKYQCTFHLGHNLKGIRQGLFIDSRLGDQNFVGDFIKNNLSLRDDVKQLYYNSAQTSNISKYTWENHIGNSGQGVQILLNPVNGETIFRRYKAETQTITDYYLVPGRIEKKLGAKKNLGDLIDLERQYLSAQDFEQVKWAFEARTETTAPDGIGYTINCDLFGDPFVCPNLRIKFNNGFPDELQRATNSAFYGLSTSKNLIYYIVRKDTHTISKNGYSTEMEIVDSYTLNGCYLQDTKQIQVIST